MADLHAWPLVGREEEVRLITATLDRREPPAVVVAGAAGVGKSRIAEETLSFFRGRGWVIKVVVATHAAGTIPFGPFAYLLPPPRAGPTSTPLDVLRQAVHRLQSEAAISPLLLHIDDAHFLDPSSATLVHQLALSRTCRVLLTVSNGEPLPDPLTALLKGKLAVRLELQPLSDVTVHQLLIAGLDRHVDGRTVHLLTSTARGNMLFLHELIHSGLSSGALQLRDGIWHWSGPIGPGSHLLELIEGRLSRLSHTARGLLEVVARSEPLELAALQRIAAEETIATIEQSGLLGVFELGHRAYARLAHPLYAQMLRERVATVQVRILLRRLADVIEAFGCRRADDYRRVAVLRFHAGEQPSSRTVLLAAHRALGLGEFSLAERLARLASGSDRSELSLILAQALMGQHRPDDAELVLASIPMMTDADRAQVMLTRAYNLAYGLGMMEQAGNVLQAAESDIKDEGLLDEVLATRALFLTAVGPISQGLEVASRVTQSTRARIRAMTRAHIAQGFALASMARPEEATRALSGALHTSGLSRESTSDLNWLLHAISWYPLWLSGRLYQAIELAERSYRAAVMDGSEVERGFWAMLLGLGALLGGRPRTSVGWLREAIGVCRLSDPHHILAGTLGMLAEASSLLRDHPSASEALHEARSLPSAVLPSNQHWLARAAAWTVAAEGNLVKARDFAQEAAQGYHAMGSFAFEAIVLHDTVRLGDPMSVASRLREIGASGQGVLFTTFADHAVALNASDGSVLDQVAARFHGIGLNLLAAEAAVEAAQAHQEAGRASPSRESLGHARVLLSNCGGAHTPQLAGLSSLGQLTAREQSIASLAGRGMASAIIAARLGISVRTVDNHLQQVFSKLEVHSRHELAGLLDYSIDGRLTE